MSELDTPSPLPDAQTGEVDPRRWITLAIVLIATLIVVLDNTVLNVAVPTILHDFHTTLPSLQWVITGYALTFAALLIIGGRLCDIHGTRRVFIVGAALFGVGSLIASVSWNVPSLVTGEAILEGIGASLMLPAALAVLSSEFHGAERGMAFAMWGAVAGSAAGLGPVVGGFLTTYYSWRWAFRINVVIAPLAILGAMLFVHRTARTGEREPLDVPGAALVSVGMLLLVFGLSEGGRYGWTTPAADFTLAGALVWSRSEPISVVPLVFVVSTAILTVFYRHERRREREEGSPLFEFGLLKYPTFRYGLLTTTVLATAALGFSLAMALYFQEALRLSAWDNGLWILPYGLLILLGSPIGGGLTRIMTTVNVVRIGLVGQTIGLVYIVVVMSDHTSFLGLLPGLVIYGLASGFAFSQLTNVILSDIPAAKSGVASGTNTTFRQVGNALGIAVIGTIVTAQTVTRAVPKIAASAALTATERQGALAGVHARGANYIPPGAPAPVARALTSIMGHAVTGATRAALVYAVIVVSVGTALSFLIPTTPDVPLSLAEDFASFVPLDPEGEFESDPGAPVESP